MINKTTLWAIAIVLVLVVIGIFAYQNRSNMQDIRNGQINLNQDTPADISNDLNDLKLDDFDKDFQDLDKDINNL